MDGDEEAEDCSDPVVLRKSLRTARKQLAEKTNLLRAVTENCAAEANQIRHSYEERIALLEKELIQKELVHDTKKPVMAADVFERRLQEMQQANDRDRAAHREEVATIQKRYQSEIEKLRQQLDARPSDLKPPYAASPPVCVTRGPDALAELSYLGSHVEDVAMENERLQREVQTHRLEAELHRRMADETVRKSKTNERLIRVLQQKIDELTQAMEARDAGAQFDLRVRMQKAEAAAVTLEAQGQASESLLTAHRHVRLQLDEWPRILAAAALPPLPPPSSSSPVEASVTPLPLAGLPHATDAGSPSPGDVSTLSALTAFQSARQGGNTVTATAPAPTLGDILAEVLPTPRTRRLPPPRPPPAGRLTLLRELAVPDVPGLRPPRETRLGGPGLVLPAIGGCQISPRVRALQLLGKVLTARSNASSSNASSRPINVRAMAAGSGRYQVPAAPVLGAARPWGARVAVETGDLVTQLARAKQRQQMRAQAERRKARGGDGDSGRLSPLVAASGGGPERGGGARSADL
ncbi:hypothetical protein PAPYR_7710 [Paratrimastix pyriformis]|uniref:Uncharacterized protein n=1 Tax=Paratrimastix pyriformis TaxID=342808 RepID=A0ABQ8UC99_9EUKA|nr:hypothetical protein PAPYR_7710 [Paratrimastix pyriformis]